MKIRASINKSPHGYTVTVRNLDDIKQCVVFKEVTDIYWARHYRTVGKCMLFDGFSGNGFDIITGARPDLQAGILTEYLRRAPKIVTVNARKRSKPTAKDIAPCVLELSDGRVGIGAVLKSTPAFAERNVRYVGGVAYLAGNEVVHAEIVNGLLEVITFNGATNEEI